MGWTRAAACSFVVGVCVFLNSLEGDFVIDDGSAVRTNLDLRPETPLSSLQSTSAQSIASSQTPALQTPGRLPKSQGVSATTLMWLHWPSAGSQAASVHSF